MKVNVKKLPKSEVEIEGEIATEEFESYHKKSLKKLGASMEVRGFRKGHVPEDVLEKKVPENSLLQDMAEEALRESYPKILRENKIDALGQPQITITKLARKNPLGFKIKTAIIPEIELPNYRKIAQEEGGLKEEVIATDEEVEKTIEQLRQMNKKEEKLPELDDEFVKKLGDFKNLADFKEKLKENIKTEKEIKARDKHRLKIMEAVVEKSKIEPPQILVDLELDKMLHKLRGDVETSGVKFDDYLKHLKKTEEDLRETWKADAEKRVKFQLVLNKIAQDEEIKIDPKDVEEETEKVLATYKGADPERARAMVEHTLTNEKVLQFLENQ